MKVDTLKKLIDRAHTKRDGVYYLDCCPYGVKNSRLAFVYDRDYRNVSQFCYGFLSPIVDCEKREAKKIILNLLAKLKGEVDESKYQRMWKRVKQIRADGCLLTSEDLDEIEKQDLKDNKENHITT